MMNYNPRNYQVTIDFGNGVSMIEVFTFEKYSNKAKEEAQKFINKMTADLFYLTPNSLKITVKDI